MSLTVNSLGENPQQPGISAEAFIPDQLIAGNLKLVTDVGTLGSGTLARGTVLGRQTGTITSAAATNTGNGTIGSISKGASAKPGVYSLVATSSTNFTVSDPNGTAIGNATVGTAFISAEVNFTLTAGTTAFAAGDEFTLQLPVGNYVQCVATAKDGSQTPVAILADAADASGGPVSIGVYLQGEFNQNALVVDASFGANAAAWSPLLQPELRRLGIFLKSSVSAADPS